jgi:hypothetical protein
MRSPRSRGPDTRSSPARPAASTPLDRLSHATTWSSGGWCRRGLRPRVKARCRAGTQPTRHGRTASKTVRGTGRGAGRGGGVAREPLVGLPGLHLHLLVGRAVAFVGGPLPRVGSAWASSRAAARRASPAWAACNAAPARPARASAARTLASSTRQGRRSAHAGPPGQPLGRGRPPSGRLFSFLALAVVGEASKASAAMAAVAHPCSREEQR